MTRRLAWLKTSHAHHPDLEPFEGDTHGCYHAVPQTPPPSWKEYADSSSDETYGDYWELEVDFGHEYLAFWPEFDDCTLRVQLRPLTASEMMEARLTVCADYEEYVLLCRMQDVLQLRPMKRTWQPGDTNKKTGPEETLEEFLVRVILHGEAVDIDTFQEVAGGRRSDCRPGEKIAALADIVLLDGFGRPTVRKVLQRRIHQGVAGSRLARELCAVGLDRMGVHREEEPDFEENPDSDSWDLRDWYRLEEIARTGSKWTPCKAGLRAEIGEVVGKPANADWVNNPSLIASWLSGRTLRE